MLCEKPLGRWRAAAVRCSLCCPGSAADPEMSRTGKSCAAVALLIVVVTGAKPGLRTPANTCVRAVCTVYHGTSGQRVLANPITKKNSNVYLVLPFFFFFQMCTNHFRKSLSRFT